MMTINLPVLVGGTLMLLSGLLNNGYQTDMSPLTLFNALVAGIGGYFVYRSIYNEPPAGV